MPLLPPLLIKVSIVSTVILILAGVLYYRVIDRIRFPIQKTLTRWVAWGAGLILLYIGIVAISNSLALQLINTRMAAAGMPSSFEELELKFIANPEVNGSSFYLEAGKLLSKSQFPKLNALQKKYPHRDLSEWSAADRTQALQYLSDPMIAQAITLFRQGALRPTAVFLRKYKGFSTELNELIFQRQLFLLLAMKCSAYALDGHAADGYPLILDGLKALKQFEPEPFLITQLHDWSNLFLLTQTMNRLLPSGIDNATARSLLAALSNLDIRHGMNQCMQGEILVLNDFYGEIMAGNTETAKMGIKAYPGMTCGPLLYWDCYYLQSRQLELKALLAKPFWEIQDKLEPLWTAKSPWCFPVAQMWERSLVSMGQRLARTESNLAAARLSLALHLYKNRNGTFPEKLEQLAPDILKEIPIDPINGKPFEYRRQGQNIIVSSVWLKEKAAREAKQRR